MKPYPLLFKPIFKEKVWGGTKLKKMFNSAVLDENIGEAWVISDHPNGKSVIENGEFTGRTLNDLLRICPEWFCNSHMVGFPLLVKLLDSNEDLSVQVHPDDEFAVINEDVKSGKTECWYIIESEPGAEIVFGHKAKNKKEFIELANEDKWDDLLVRISVQPGDFFLIPSGTVHAIGKGIVLLEVQQNSDITYRLYDYNRIGLDGKKRDLHMEKALNVIRFEQDSYNERQGVSGEN
ncbi:mannose-6-phosphate isomerase [Desulfocucumis palustris]|uniref:Mannose-6-phosphate isomerase n=1 Tax=Desulfocucumis palustris TaxID=1898651 RepID=A0A2L2XJ03_9FIRM|nr:type I phosphomannose isomerase catalytic subunit [Desulfocucumis palustris]GBF33911.1 mannose-6-phosphate isomerase [Desulfocucumis palustris]